MMHRAHGHKKILSQQDARMGQRQSQGQGQTQGQGTLPPWSKLGVATGPEEWRQHGILDDPVFVPVDRPCGTQIQQLSMRLIGLVVHHFAWQMQLTTLSLCDLSRLRWCRPPPAVQQMPPSLNKHRSRYSIAQNTGSEFIPSCFFCSLASVVPSGHRGVRLSSRKPHRHAFREALASGWNGKGGHVVKTKLRTTRVNRGTWAFILALPANQVSIAMQSSQAGSL